MAPLVDSNLEAIRDLCRVHRVLRLELFGSAVGESFDASHSDVDFLVEFPSDADLGPWLGRYFDFKDELERLLGRPVDLVMSGALKNPFMIEEVNRTRRVIYAR